MNYNENDKYITFKILDEYEDVFNCYTKRPYNFVSGLPFEEEKPEYDELQEFLGTDFKKIVRPKQNHSTNVEILTEDNLEEEFKGVDGLVTNLKNVGIMTISADCQNIILYDHINKVIANVHSGWKGTLGRIIDNAINIMICDFSCDPKNIIAVISPSIHKCHFEVDEDVKDAFLEVFDNIDEDISKGKIIDGKQKYYIDLVGINTKEMMKFGILKDNISNTDICTVCDNETYHSHRATNCKSGRNVCLVALK